MRGQFPGFGIFGQYCSANRTGNVTFAKLVIQLGYLYFVGRAFFCDTGIAALKRRDLCFQLFFQNGNLGVNIIYLFWVAAFSFSKFSVRFLSYSALPICSFVAAICLLMSVLLLAIALPLASNCIFFK